MTRTYTKWATPLTGKVSEVGAARLKQGYYAKGFYPMEGIGGDEYYIVNRRIPVMELQRREGGEWKTWMVDDPLHWIAMRARVMELPPGKLLCAGLGMGLMLHHLAAERPDIGEIIVVEIDKDVIELIQPTLPKDDRVTILNANYYEVVYEIGSTVNGILWDLAVGDGDKCVIDFILARRTAPAGVPLYRFGERTPGPVFSDRR